MSNKLVWSNNMTMNSLAALKPEDLRVELIDYGYDEELVNTLTDDELYDKIVYSDDLLWQVDDDMFDQEIEPMINKQTCDGIVLMVGEAARWDGKRSAGKAVFTEHLKGSVDPDVDVVRIEDDGEGLVWLGSHHDGTHRFALYALPEENQVEFIQECMEDAIDDEMMWYHDEENLDDAFDSIIEDILARFTDLDYLNDYINFNLVPNFCKRIKNESNIAVGENLKEDHQDKEWARVTVDWLPEYGEFETEEDVVMDVRKSFDDLPSSISIKVATMKGGPWGFTPEVTLEGPRNDLYKCLLDNGWDSTDVFDEIADGWIDWETLENYKDEYDASLNEANTKEPKKLAKELKEIKKIADNYGYEYLTSMPFSNFDNDPISIEYNYPEFARIVKAFFVEMGDMTREEAKTDIDQLDLLWDQNISQHDWDTIIAACEELASGKTRSSQIEKIYKKGYNSFLDDDQILADREGDPDYVEEKLEEKSTSETITESKHSLPNKLRIDLETDGNTDDEIEQYINDYLSDTYGYLVKNYDWEIIEPYGDIRITNIEWDLDESLNEDISEDRLDDYYNMFEAGGADINDIYEDGYINACSREDLFKCINILDDNGVEYNVEKGGLFGVEVQILDESLNEGAVDVVSEATSEDVFSANEIERLKASNSFKKVTPTKAYFNCYYCGKQDYLTPKEMEASFDDFVESPYPPICHKCDAEDHNESLNEGAAEEISMHKFKEEIVDYIYDSLLSEVDTNLAPEIANKFSEYNLEWCNDDGDDFVARKVENHKMQLARAIADSLFKYAPKEL